MPGSGSARYISTNCRITGSRLDCGSTSVSNSPRPRINARRAETSDSAVSRATIKSGFTPKVPAARGQTNGPTGPDCAAAAARPSRAGPAGAGPPPRWLDGKRASPLRRACLPQVPRVRADVPASRLCGPGAMPLVETTPQMLGLGVTQQVAERLRPVSRVFGQHVRGERSLRVFALRVAENGGQRVQTAVPGPAAGRRAAIDSNWGSGRSRPPTGPPRTGPISATWRLRTDRRSPGAGGPETRLGVLAAIAQQLPEACRQVLPCAVRVRPGSRLTDRAPPGVVGHKGSSTCSASAGSSPRLECSLSAESAAASWYASSSGSAHAGSPPTHPRFAALADVCVQQSVDQPFGITRVLPLDHLAADQQAGGHTNQEQRCRQARTDSVVFPRHPHHHTLRPGPAAGGSQPAGCSGTPTSRASCWFSGLALPQFRPLLQPQFGPAAAGFLLLAGQPLAERGNQVVVRQLVVPVPGFGHGLRWFVLGRGTLGIGGRDQPEFAVEDPQQVVEVLGRRA